MSSRHAYLILAYAQPLMLQRLIAALDDPRNDIFVHVDKKGTGFRFQDSGFKSSSATRHSSLVIIDSTDARWGDVSLVEVELNLIEAALQHDPYTYFHLLSDSDFPIKSQDYIHAECERLAGTEFIGYAQTKEGELEVKMHRYHLFPKDFKNGNIWKHVLRKGWLTIQKVVCCRRHGEMDFRKGPQWWSITSDLATYVLSQKEAILSTYHHTFCPDEVFMQTLCWHSEFRERLAHANNEFIGCRRFIPWQNNTIRTIKGSDLPVMQASPCWFARKFDERQLPFLHNIENSLK